MPHLKYLLKLEDENINFSAEDQHFRCIVHISNLAVRDVLKLLKVPCDENTNVMQFDSELPGNVKDDSLFSSDAYEDDVIKSNGDTGDHK